MAAVLTAFALCVVSAVLAARADAYVYWTNDTGTIGRANLDGSNVDQAFITGPAEPFGVAVDANHVYWADHDQDSIGRANIDGTSVDEDFIAATNPQGVAVNASHIYWTNDTVGVDTIGRANVDGTAVDQDFITSGDITFDIANNASHIYWANYSGSAIGRANLDGTGVAPTLIPSPGDDPQGVAVGGGRVYWSAYDQVDPAIARANLDGSDPDLDFIPGLSNPYGIAVNASHLFFIDRSENAVSRATLDGGTVTASFIGGAIDPRGVAVDSLPLPPPPPDPPDTDPPETEITKSPPNKGEKPKAKYRFESDEPGSAFECKLKGKGLKKKAKKFGECDPPEKYKRLDEGRFRFEVRAIDSAGNVDPSPAEDKFKVLG